MDFKAYLQSVRKYWPQLFQAASAVSITIAGFIKPPAYFDPVATVSETKRLAVFVVAVLMAIFFYIAFKWSLRKHAKRWALIAFVFLLTMVVSDLVFRERRVNCICSYDQKPVLIGTELTAVGGADLQKRAGVATCEDLLMDFQGRANLIWTSTSINTCRRSITIAYWFTFSIAGLTVLSALQIIRVLQARR
jgi:hypothetical protein